MGNGHSGGCKHGAEIDDQIQEVLLEIEWLLRKRFTIRDATNLEFLEREVVRVTDRLASLVVAQKLQQELDSALLTSPPVGTGPNCRCETNPPCDSHLVIPISIKDAPTASLLFL